MRMNSRWRSVRFSLSVVSSSSMKPLIDVSGLRSSCDAVATKSLLACSRRARSVMSRSVHTTPPSGPARRAAVTASVGSPSRRTVTSRASASESGGSGLPAPLANEPIRSPGTSSPARGFSDVTRPPLSQMTRPSPRLWIVVARRWRWFSMRSLAAARSAPIALKATPTASSSFGPPAFTRAPRSPEDIRRVAPTRSSSGWRMARMSSVRKASTPTSASPAPKTIASSAVRERSVARSRGLVAAHALAGADALHGGAHVAQVAGGARAGGVDRRVRAPGAGPRGARGRRPPPARGSGRRRRRAARRARRRRRSSARRPRRSGRRGASGAARGSPPAPPSRSAGWPPRPRARTPRRPRPRSAGGPG